MSDQEKEVKLILSGNEYGLLCDYLATNGTFLAETDQRNVYLDSADRLLMAKSEMFRLRLTETSILITHKYDLESQNGFFQCSQRERVFPRAESIEILELLSSLPLEEFHPFLPSSLEVIGEMENHRKTFSWNGFKVELDKTSMPDATTEFELECETDAPDRFQASIVSVFDELGITIKFQIKTKYARFIDRLNLLEKA